jgi:hypothetical protein
MSVQDKSRTLKHLTVVGDSERTRTSNLLIRSQGLYPLSYGAIPVGFRAAKVKRVIPKNQTRI